MTVTAGLMIDEVIGTLQSWALDEEQSTTLAGDITDTDLTFNVTEARGTATVVSAGILEIEQELLFASHIDGTQVTVPPWGRGYKNTTPAAHSGGARIVSQPTFPRSKVLDAMNQVLERVFPQVFAVKSYETTATFPVRTYDIPDDAQFVVDAKWQVPDGSKGWMKIRQWRVSAGGGTQFGDGLNGITVDVGEYIMPGRPIQFLYAAKPTPMPSESDVFSAVTGLDPGVRDVVTMGAAVALVMSQELSRLQVASVEQQNRSQLVAPSAALTSSRFLEQRFQTRLLEERKALQRRYPPRISGGRP